MRLGIDLGTTRTIVAVADRGNYPVVTFENAEGDFQEWYPSLLAVRGCDRRYGFEALALADDPEWTIHRSFKRLLATTSPNGVLFGVPALTLLDEEHRALELAMSRVLKTPRGRKLWPALYGVVFHDIYHAGQIRLLRRLQS